MTTILQLQLAFLWLIRVSVATRLVYCFIQMIKNDEEIELYKKRIRNVIAFYVFAELIWQFKDIAIT